MFNGKVEIWILSFWLVMCSFIFLFWGWCFLVMFILESILSWVVIGSCIFGVNLLILCKILLIWYLMWKCFWCGLRCILEVFLVNVFVISEFKRLIVGVFEVNFFNFVFLLFVNLFFLILFFDEFWIL